MLLLCFAHWLKELFDIDYIKLHKLVSILLVRKCHTDAGIVVFNADLSAPVFYCGVVLGNYGNGHFRVF